MYINYCLLDYFEGFWIESNENQQVQKTWRLRNHVVELTGPVVSKVSEHVSENARVSGVRSVIEIDHHVFLKVIVILFYLQCITLKLYSYSSA